MTPSINYAKQNKINYQIHEYVHDTGAESYGDEAVQKLGIPSQQVFKTLVVNIDHKTLVVAVIPVSSMLSMKLIAKVCGGKKSVMALKEDVERSTGYVLGGVSPLGQKKQLKTVIDSSATSFKTIFVSAGKRGVELELSPQDLQTLTKASLANICQ
jgi:Cys-tRNA(Pro)/Cys-tRNA(Cys) deacylase